VNCVVISRRKSAEARGRKHAKVLWVDGSVSGSLSRASRESNMLGTGRYGAVGGRPEWAYGQDCLVVDMSASRERPVSTNWLASPRRTCRKLLDRNDRRKRMSPCRRRLSRCFNRSRQKIPQISCHGCLGGTPAAESYRRSKSAFGIVGGTGRAGMSGKYKLEANSAGMNSRGDQMSESWRSDVSAS